MNDSIEKISVVLPNLSKKKGMFSLRREYFTLILTERRMVFAKFTKELSKKQIHDVKQIIADNKKNKTGFLTSMADRMFAYSHWFNRYETMGINEIINESSDNLVFNKNEVVSLKILEFMEVNEDSYQEKTQSPILVLKINNSKYRFLLNPGFNPSDLMKLKQWCES